MKPLTGFDLLRPRTVVGALEMMATLELAKPIAGGTDLIPTYRDLGYKAEHLVDLGLIPELNGILEDGEKLMIGPTTTHSQILASSAVAEKAPALYDAVKWIGSIQIRNRGTIGGNLCNASPAADTAPPLMVHSAKAKISSLSNSQWIDVKDFFVGPKMTILESDELLTGLMIPIIKGAGSSFQRIGRRKGFTLSVVNAAAYLERDGDSIKDVKLALGSVAPTPIRVPKVEDNVRGKAMSYTLIEEASNACKSEAKPVDDVRGTAEYRRDMTAVLVKRAMLEAWSRAGGELK